MDEYLMDVRQCAGFGRTDRPIHELTADIYACDDCIAVTTAVLAPEPEDDD